MQSGRDRLNHLMEVIARMMGSKDAAFNSSVHASKFAIQGDGTIFSKLPSKPIAPAVNYTSGNFRFMVDVSLIDGDDEL